MDRCPLSPNRICIWQEMGCYWCQRRILELAVQQLRWSLPFGIGKYFRTHEHRVECNRKEEVK